MPRPIAKEQVHIIFAWKCMSSVNTMPKENIRLCDVTEDTPTSLSFTARVTSSLLKRSKIVHGTRFIVSARTSPLSQLRPATRALQKNRQNMKKNELVIQRRTFRLHWRASWTYTAVRFRVTVTCKPNSISQKAGDLSVKICEVR